MRNNAIGEAGITVNVIQNYSALQIVIQTIIIIIHPGHTAVLKIGSHWKLEGDSSGVTALRV